MAAGYVDTGKEPARSSIGTWDAVTGKPIGTISPDVTILSNSLTFTPDSKRIVGGCVDPQPDKDFSGVIEWDVASGKEERRYDAVHVTPGGHSFVHAIRYTRDGKWLIIGGGETVSDPAFPNSSHLYGYAWLFAAAHDGGEKLDLQETLKSLRNGSASRTKCRSAYTSSMTS